jgi:hypothetical protein
MVDVDASFENGGLFWQILRRNQGKFLSCFDEGRVHAVIAKILFGTLAETELIFPDKGFFEYLEEIEGGPHVLGDFFRNSSMAVLESRNWREAILRIPICLFTVTDVFSNDRRYIFDCLQHFHYSELDERHYQKIMGFFCERRDLLSELRLSVHIELLDCLLALSTNRPSDEFFLLAVQFLSTFVGLELFSSLDVVTRDRLFDYLLTPAASIENVPLDILCQVVSCVTEFSLAAEEFKEISLPQPVTKADTPHQEAEALRLWIGELRNSIRFEDLEVEMMDTMAEMIQLGLAMPELENNREFVECCAVLFNRIVDLKRDLVIVRPALKTVMRHVRAVDGRDTECSQQYLDLFGAMHQCDDFFDAVSEIVREDL